MDKLNRPPSEYIRYLETMLAELADVSDGPGNPDRCRAVIVDRLAVGAHYKAMYENLVVQLHKVNADLVALQAQVKEVL
jgi:hypothetical protein